MVQPATALLPVFRSEQQMRILVEVFCGAAPLTGAELSRKTGVPQPTVAREVGRLARAGLVLTTQVGSAKEIRANPDLPYGDALRQLLTYAGGIVAQIDAKFRGNPNVIEVFVFGSWARRFRGEPGKTANDVDVAIVSSTLSRFDLAESRLELESESGLAVNLFVFEPGQDRLNEIRPGSVPVIERHSR
jgi:predicted nucleotidyltransferase